MATAPELVDSDAQARSLLGLILAVALAARVAAAFVVQWYAGKLGKPCLFGDTFIYWGLARSIREGGGFVVDQFGVPHYALRTPGYPLFLAGCQTIFGPNSYLAVRLVQAALGTVGVYFLYRLTTAVGLPRRTALVAAGFAAVEPYGVGLGALILSEGLFTPLMIVGLWLLARLWAPSAGNEPAPRRPRPGVFAAAAGVVHAAAILTRPSWALALPLLLGAWLASRRWGAVRGVVVVAAVAAALMAPWWVRNERIFGRFVPTALWIGASLYDGVSPEATGASDMEFLARPGIVELDETAQDAELKRRALDFARAQPLAVARLVLVKAARFWSPWPNAETLRSRVAAWASAAVVLPLYGLVVIGAWRLRGDFRALVLLAGPLAYFFALHVVFVSSIRYRIPGVVPALGLAAVGWERIVGVGFVKRSLAEGP
jgi:hypothetical protein